MIILILNKYLGMLCKRIPSFNVFITVCLSSSMTNITNCKLIHLKYRIYYNISMYNGVQKFLASDYSDLMQSVT